MEERIIAFLDVLGFSEDVKYSSDQERIIRILEKASSVNNQGSIKQTPNGYEIVCTTTAFSDSVIISLPLYPNIHGPDFTGDKGFIYCDALEIISSTISSFISFFLEEGYLVRGGISCGLVKHDKNILGKAYIEAVEAEKNFALMPRVVLCNQLLKSLLKSELEKKHSCLDILRDNDGVFYIDWLSKLFFIYSRNLDVLEKHRVSILNGLEKYKSNQKYFAKWCWMANHFNTYVPLYLKAHHKDDYNFLPIEVSPF